ncbi:MAG: hypothetical protein P0Y55_12165 [Candidatus Cohnella colombiensis]|uniref:Uncharacterized protein n=1 Tax=Candidatus Cohnella colombiensis TaxID=3121368 RepID=A0AA95EUA3_9BACL|nr:MAG: hypothetical protein P0Y55_12165 [Cohnella sp.]
MTSRYNPTNVLLDGSVTNAKIAPEAVTMGKLAPDVVSAIQSSGGGSTLDYPIPTVKFYGAVGDGIADDTAAVVDAMASSNSSIRFPKVRYNITSNITLPEGKTLIFDSGAYLFASSGITVTVNSEIIANPHPIFVGDGTYVRAVGRKMTVHPQWFGGSGESSADRAIVTETASITAGTKILTIPSGDVNKFRDGQTIMVLHAGSNNTATHTDPTPVPTLTMFGTAGTTTYKYRIATLDKNGGITSASTVVTINNAPDQLSYLLGNKIRITMPVGTPRHGYAIYGEESNPASSRGIIGIIRDVTAFWDDLGQGNIANAIPPWIPPTAPTVKLHNTLLTTIVSGGGTNMLILKDNAINTVSGNGIVMMENASAFNKAFNFLETCGGGEIEVPSGTYYIHTNPATSRSVFITDNVNVKGVNKPIIMSHFNPCCDNIAYLVNKNASSTGWSFEEIIFDGSNRTYTTEAAEIFINLLGVMYNSYFEIRGCEFRYFRGKFISTNGGNCTDYRITDCHFHHGCSNALGIGGHRYSVDNNVFSDIFMGYDQSGGSKVGGAECIIMRSLAFGSNDITSNGSIRHNFFNNYGTINFGGAQFRYKNIDISHNKILTYGDAIGIGGIMENVTIANNHIDVLVPDTAPFNSNTIKVEMTAIGQGCDGLNIVGNELTIRGNTVSNRSSSGINFSVNSANVDNANRVRITNNKIRMYNIIDQLPIVVQHCRDVVISGNEVLSDSVGSKDLGISITIDNSKDNKWVIANNIMPNRSVQAPSGSVITGNRVGGVRMNSNSVLQGNIIDSPTVNGEHGWGGAVLIQGSNNVVSGNRIDLTNHFSSSGNALTETTGAKNNLITGNMVSGIGSRTTTLVTQNESVITNNVGFLVSGVVV